MNKIIIFLIKIHRVIFHPLKRGFRDAGIELNRCYFIPTCSEYAILALKKYHCRIALKKIFDRLKRCNHNTEKIIDYP